MGATVVSPRAGETMGELTMAVSRRLSVRDLAGITHAYPTFNDGPWRAAVNDVDATLRRFPMNRGLSLVVGLRRWWLARTSR